MFEILALDDVKNSINLKHNLQIGYVLEVPSLFQISALSEIRNSMKDTPNHHLPQINS